MRLIHGETLEEMSKLDAASVELILVDPPYGTIKGRDKGTHLKNVDWDVVIDTDEMFKQWTRILKPGGRLVVFGNNAYTQLIRQHSTTALKYTYPMYWYKNHFGSPLNAKRAPLSYVEDISVFNRVATRKDDERIATRFNVVGGKKHVPNILKFNKDVPSLHPTQKPVELMKYLIEVFSNVGDTVLDNTMGSGSTGVGAVKAGRDFIGIELDDAFYEIATNRINEVLEGNY